MRKKDQAPQDAPVEDVQTEETPQEETAEQTLEEIAPEQVVTPPVTSGGIDALSFQWALEERSHLLSDHPYRFKLSFTYQGSDGYSSTASVLFGSETKQSVADMFADIVARIQGL